MDAFTDAQRRTRATLDAAWRAGHPLGGRHDRASWRTLVPGADVVAADGARVGAVQELVADDAADIFDGVVVDLRLGPGGLHYVEAAGIAMIFDHRIVLQVPSARVQDLRRSPVVVPGAAPRERSDAGAHLAGHHRGRLLGRRRRGGAARAAEAGDEQQGGAGGEQDADGRAR